MILMAIGFLILLVTFLLTYHRLNQRNAILEVICNALNFKIDGRSEEAICKDLSVIAHRNRSYNDIVEGRKQLGEDYDALDKRHRDLKIQYERHLDAFRRISKIVDETMTETDIVCDKCGGDSQTGHQRFCEKPNA